jgi:hypothetical protein
LILLQDPVAPGLPICVPVRLLRALGFRYWDWRTCWRTVDFWIAMATLLLPFGFLLLLLQWEPIRTRVGLRR